LTKLARAIIARIDGVFDDPDLVAFGPLGDTLEDVKRFAEETLRTPATVPGDALAKAVEESLFQSSPPGVQAFLRENREAFASYIAKGYSNSDAPAALQPFTVVFYRDGDYGVDTYVEQVEAADQFAAFEAAVEQAIKLYKLPQRFRDGATEIITFKGHQL